MVELGVERLCVFDMPPVPFVELAADLGCTCIGTGLTAMRYYNPHGYADWSLRDDAVLRREMLAAMQDVGVGISLLEGFGIAPGKDVREQAGDLDLLCELRGKRINAASLDRDRSRSFDGFAALAEMADERGLEVVIEIGPGPVRTLDEALAAVSHVGQPNFRLLIDAMHYFRFGGTIAGLAALNPALIGYVQLCDVPLRSLFPSYMEEALHERQVPGMGELPLLDLLRLVPAHVPVSVEVPQRSLAEKGIGPRDRVAACVAATRSLLLEAGREVFA